MKGTSVEDAMDQGRVGDVRLVKSRCAKFGRGRKKRFSASEAWALWPESEANFFLDDKPSTKQYPHHPWRTLLFEVSSRSFTSLWDIEEKIFHFEEVINLWVSLIPLSPPVALTSHRHYHSWKPLSYHPAKKYQTQAIKGSASFCLCPEGSDW